MKCAYALLYWYVWPVRLCHIFLYYLTNDTILQKENVLEYKMCVLIFSIIIFSETFLILRRTKRDIFVNVHSSPTKVPVTLVRY
jgi:hypothetical protein